MKTPEQQTAKETPIEDLKQQALDHYMELSKECCSYNSFVIECIKEYKPETKIDSKQKLEQEGEIEHGIPFKCPECGEEIQYGLSEEGRKLFANSRLFKNPEQKRFAKSEEETFPDIDFRKDIAMELSREELIDRLCEMHETYKQMRDAWLKCLTNQKPINMPSEAEINKKYPSNIWINEYVCRGIKWFKHEIKKRNK